MYLLLDASVPWSAAADFHWHAANSHCWWSRLKHRRYWQAPILFFAVPTGFLICQVCLLISRFDLTTLQPAALYHPGLRQPIRCNATLTVTDRSGRTSATNTPVTIT